LLPISSLLMLLGSASALAADLHIPMSFEYLALNGQKVESSAFNHKSQLALAPGTHKIAIRYHEMVEDDFSDSQTFVKSSPFILTLEVEGDYQYYLQAAEGKVVKRPKEYAKNPQVALTRSDKGQIHYQVSQTTIQEEGFVSRLFSGNQATDVASTAVQATGSAAATAPTVAASSALALTAATDTATNTVTNTATSTKANPSPNNAPNAAASPEQMLQYWWLQADDKTRKEFMSWAISQL
ncbi:MAG: DUF2057 domain-containing protein, partial [Shewanella sp.]